MEDNEREKLIREIEDLNARIIQMEEDHRAELEAMGEELDEANETLKDIGKHF